jgi:hypothetical protein
VSVQSFDEDSRRVHLPARLADRSHLLPATSSEQAGGGAAATFAESPDAERPAAAVRTSAFARQPARAARSRWREAVGKCGRASFRLSA